MIYGVLSGDVISLVLLDNVSRGSSSLHGLAPTTVCADMHLINSDRGH